MNGKTIFFQQLFVTLRSKKMKQLTFVFYGILLLMSCQAGSICNKLAEVDSLIVSEEYDSAYQTLLLLENTNIKNEDDIAHYNLLKVQTSYLVSKPLISADSLLNMVIDYYQKANNLEKLADAYYYKAYCSFLNKDMKLSILFHKKAEESAKLSNNKRIQFKIYEGISFMNGKCANYGLQLEYAKKALEMAKQLNNKKWIAYSFFRVGSAYSNMNIEDSVLFYFNKIEPYTGYMDNKTLPLIQSSLGYLLMDKHPRKAKEYLLKSISLKEMTKTYEYLAYILYEEGKPEQAYQYWKKALAVPDQSPKDIVIRNLIEYDLERGKTDSISDMVTQIFEIRDSIDAKLKDDTIKDLQTRFDHELALKEKDREFVRGILIMTIVIFVLIGVFSAVYFRRRHLVKLQMLDYQMQINDNLRQIEILQASGTDTKQEVERLNKLIEDIMQNKAPKLDRGRMLYDDIMNGNITMIDWNREHEQMFLDYYTATHYDTVQKMKNVKRVEKLTPHKLFYLILVKLGKTDEQIQQMMSVSDSTLRGLKHRTKPI